MSNLALDFPTTSAGDIANKASQECREQLSQDIYDYWDQENADWDAQVLGSSDGAVSEGTDSDLWGAMPTVDSKAVARTSPIFEKHLGRPLDIRLIRPGGYKSIDEAIRHLVPAMMENSHAPRGIRVMK